MDDAPPLPARAYCPHCHRDTLDVSLEADVATGGSPRPVLVHQTTCRSCGANRRVEVDLDDAPWADVPGQTTLDLKPVDSV